MSDSSVIKYAIQQLSICDDRFKFLDSKNLIIGRRSSGKTNLAFTILNTIKEHINDLYYFSGKVEEFSGCNLDILECATDEIKIYDYDDLPKLDSIIRSIVLRKKEALKNGSEYHACIILDDVFFSNSKFASYRPFRDLMYNGKTYGITTIITVQYPYPFKFEIHFTSI